MGLRIRTTHRKLRGIVRDGNFRLPYPEQQDSGDTRFELARDSLQALICALEIRAARTSQESKSLSRKGGLYFSNVGVPW